MRTKKAYGKGMRIATSCGKVFRQFGWVLIAIVLGVSQASMAFATPGDLDTTFSGDGKQTADFYGFSDYGEAVVIQADGKIVVAGTAMNSGNNSDFALARFNANGSPDANFDGDGKVTTDFQGENDGIAAMVISNSNILVGGFATTTAGGRDFALGRYLPDGSPDNSFSGNGRLVTDISGEDQGLSMVIQPDGKIVLAGAVDIGGTYDFGIVRYNSNGTLDTTFNGDGKQTTDFGAEDGAFGVALQSDGKIVAAGFTGSATSPYDFAVARYNTNGDLDTTFSFDGKATTDFSGGEDIAIDVLVQSDGKIVLGGQADFTDGNFGMVRYLTDGTLDNSFSGNGKVNTDFGDADAIYELEMQSNNRIVAFGANGTTNYAVARYHLDGSLDTTFSSDGKVSTPFDGTAGAGVIQPDGKLVAAGIASSDFGVVRYEGDVPATPTPTVTATRTRTPTATPTNTSTNTPLPTQTVGGPTATPIPTSTPTSTFTPTAASTNTPSNTPTNLPLPTQTPGGPSATAIPTDTPTTIPTNAPTSTRTSTRTSTLVSTPTNAAGGTATPTACTLEFEDVPPSNTFYANVRCLACRGHISGYACGGPGEPCNGNGDPYFRPGNLVTRGQIAKIASNSAGFNEPVSGQIFEDVGPGTTFYDFVGRLVARGVMSGYACGGPGETCNPPFNRPYFRPNATATRGQLAKITSNAAGFNEPVSDQTFEDVETGSTFYDYVERLVARSVMSGYMCGGAGEPCVGPGNLPYFRPNDNVTRGQTSKIVGNAFFPGCNTP